MLKRKELSNPESCLNRAHDEEMTFVLLGRDAAAPTAIRAWVEERIRLGKNTSRDVQVLEALECARSMEMNAGVRFADPVEAPHVPVNIAAMNMTLRDYFAGLTLASIVRFDIPNSQHFTAERCYQIADAMLAERAKTGGGKC